MLRGSPAPSQAVAAPQPQEAPTAVAAPQPQEAPTTPDAFSVPGVRGRCTWPRGRAAVGACAFPPRHAPAHIPAGASSPHALPRSPLCAPLADGRTCDAGPLCWPLVVGLAISLAGGPSVQWQPPHAVRCRHRLSLVIGAWLASNGRARLFKASTMVRPRRAASTWTPSRLWTATLAGRHKEARSCWLSLPPPVAHTHTHTHTHTAVAHPGRGEPEEERQQTPERPTRDQGARRPVPHGRKGGRDHRDREQGRAGR